MGYSNYSLGLLFHFWLFLSFSFPAFYIHFSSIYPSVLSELSVKKRESAVEMFLPVSVKKYWDFSTFKIHYEYRNAKFLTHKYPIEMTHL
jgi:hypothetical protein